MLAGRADTGSTRRVADFAGSPGANDGSGSGSVCAICHRTSNAEGGISAGAELAARRATRVRYEAPAMSGRTPFRAHDLDIADAPVAREGKNLGFGPMVMLGEQMDIFVDESGVLAQFR